SADSLHRPIGDKSGRSHGPGRRNNHQRHGFPDRFQSFALGRLQFDDCRSIRRLHVLVHDRIHSEQRCVQLADAHRLVQVQYLRWEPNTDAHTNADSDTNTDADCHANADDYAVPDSNSDGQPDSDDYAVPDSNSDGQPDSDDYAGSNGYPHTDCYTD